MQDSPQCGIISSKLTRVGCLEERSSYLPLHCPTARDCPHDPQSDKSSQNGPYRFKTHFHFIHALALRFCSSDGNFMLYARFLTWFVDLKSKSENIQNTICFQHGPTCKRLCKGNIEVLTTDIFKFTICFSVLPIIIFLGIELYILHLPWATESFDLPSLSGRGDDFKWVSDRCPTWHFKFNSQSRLSQPVQGPED